MSIPNDVWGPATWNVMYSFSHALPNVLEGEKKSIIDFFTSIMMLLPCNECKTHFKDYMERIPIDEHVNTREEILKWVNNLHNEVNSKINAPKVVLNDKIKNLMQVKPIIGSTSFSIQKKNKTAVIPRRPCNCGKKNLKKRFYK